MKLRLWRKHPPSHPGHIVWLALGSAIVTCTLLAILRTEIEGLPVILALAALVSPSLSVYWCATKWPSLSPHRMVAFLLVSLPLPMFLLVMLLYARKGTDYEVAKDIVEVAMTHHCMAHAAALVSILFLEKLNFTFPDGDRSLF